MLKIFRYGAPRYRLTFDEISGRINLLFVDNFVLNMSVLRTTTKLGIWTKYIRAYSLMLIYVVFGTFQLSLDEKFREFARFFLKCKVYCDCMQFNRIM